MVFMNKKHQIKSPYLEKIDLNLRWKIYYPIENAGKYITG